jgi:hypothetical protein
MKRKRVIVAYIVAAIVIAAVMGYALRPREPEYQGRRLSEWQEDFDGDQETLDKATMAVKEMGTNAVPFLLDAIRAKEPVWESKLVWLKWKVMGITGHREPWSGDTPNRQGENEAVSKEEKTPFQMFQAFAKGLIGVPRSEVGQKLRAHRAQKRKQSK